MQNPTQKKRGVRGDFCFSQTEKEVELGGRCTPTEEYVKIGERE